MILVQWFEIIPSTIVDHHTSFLSHAPFSNLLHIRWTFLIVSQTTTGWINDRYLDTRHLPHRNDRQKEELVDDTTIKLISYIAGLRLSSSLSEIIRMAFCPSPLSVLNDTECIVQSNDNTDMSCYDFLHRLYLRSWVLRFYHEIAFRTGNIHWIWH